MIIKNDSVVVVYNNSKNMYLRSVYSRFEGMVQEYRAVAYIEELGVLCNGLDTYYYDMDRYVNDIMCSDFVEMTYKDYIEGYKSKLQSMFPDAPVLNDVVQESPQTTFGSSEPLPLIDRFNPNQGTKQILLDSPTSGLDNLKKKGVNVTLLRG